MVTGSLRDFQFVTPYSLRATALYLSPDPETQPGFGRQAAGRPGLAPWEGEAGRCGAGKGFSGAFVHDGDTGARIAVATCGERGTDGPRPEPQGRSRG